MGPAIWRLSRTCTFETTPVTGVYTVEDDFGEAGYTKPLPTADDDEPDDPKEAAATTRTPNFSRRCECTLSRQDVQEEVRISC